MRVRITVALCALLLAAAIVVSACSDQHTTSTQASPSITGQATETSTTTPPQVTTTSPQTTSPQVTSTLSVSTENTTSLTTAILASKAGTVTLIFLAQPRAGRPVTTDALNLCVHVLQARLNKLGLQSSTVSVTGSRQITAKILADLDAAQVARVKKTLGMTASLEFFNAQEFGSAFGSLADALTASGVPSVDQLPAGHEIIYWPEGADNPAFKDQWYVVTAAPAITGNMLSSVSVGHDSNAGQPKVNLSFKPSGVTAFDKVTKSMADAYRLTGEDQRLAIVLDGVVQSAPRVMEEIPGGEAEITGNFTLDEARDLVLVLQTGPLPLVLTPE